MNKFVITSITIMSLIMGVMLTRILVLESELKSVGNQVVLQSGAINRGLKNLVPLVLPQGIEDEISKIETQLKSESTWPKTTSEIQQLTDRLASVVNKLPPWAQEELLPRLVPRRWDVEALWILANDPLADVDTLNEYVSKIQSHLATKPTDSSDEIEKLLEQKLQKVNVEIPKAEQVAAISAAKKALETKQDMETALRGIVVYENDEAKSLAKRLNDFILDKSFNQEISLLERDIEQYEKIADVTMREYAIVRANQAVMDLRLRISSSGIKVVQLDAKISNLDKIIGKKIKDANSARQLRDAEKIKQYQVWALNEIKLVRTLKAIEDIELKNISLIDLSARSQAKSKALRILIEELVAHMASINQAILDPAVSQWYGKVYQRQFTDLANEGGQLEVVTRFSTAHKKTIEELP